MEGLGFSFEEEDITKIAKILKRQEMTDADHNQLLKEKSQKAVSILAKKNREQLLYLGTANKCYPK